MPRRGTLWRGGMKITRAERHPHCHPDRSGGIFLAHRYSAVCVIAENGKPLAKGARNDGVQGRFLAALEMTVGGMGLFHAAYNGYVWKGLFPYRHAERSRGIFLAEGDNVVCVIAEKGKPFAKGARKSRVQGRFLAALEMTVWRDALIRHILQRLCRESTLPVSSSEAKPAPNAIYPFISIAHHAFLIIIYFSNLEYFLWIYLRRHAGNNRCKCISLYDLINSRLCKFRNSINSYVNVKQK